MLNKVADLAGPGIGNCDDLWHILPDDYRSSLTPKETQQAIFAAKQYIEQNLCKELNLMMVEVPLIVDVDSGVNDYLDRDGSRTPRVSTSAMITTSTPLMRKWCRRRPSGSAWR